MSLQQNSYSECSEGTSPMTYQQLFTEKFADAKLFDEVSAPSPKGTNNVSSLLTTNSYRRLPSRKTFCLLSTLIKNHGLVNI
jgi:hypothetical protein